MKTLPRIVSPPVLLAGLLVAASWPGPARAISVDGYVHPAEGYQQIYDVTFDIEHGPSGVPGGKLYLAQSADRLYVGMVLPLTVCDNTYAPDLDQHASDDARADDWGDIAHPLNKLEESDKWEIAIKDFRGKDDLTLRMDYIEQKDGLWSAQVDKFKLGANLDRSAVMVKTSLDYNFNVLGLTQFFADARNSSSPPASNGFYDFQAPYQDWLAEIAYELVIDRDAIPGLSLDEQVFRQSLLAHSVFHLSPNKLAGNKVYIQEVAAVAVPLPLAAWSALPLLCGMMVAAGRRRAGR